MFTPIDQSTWPRREHFAYYRSTLPCANSVTTQLDVTRFRAMLQKNHIKFYPAFIWCVSHTLLSHPDFRLAVDQDGNPGTHNVLHPNYTVFHEDDHTFSDLWTAHDEDFSAFYRAFLHDLELYGSVHGMKPKSGQPWNFYCISCVPWLDFTGYATMVPGGQPHLFPVLTYGRFTERDGKLTLPFSLSISHAAVDGWHISQFFRGVQDLLDTVELTAEG